MIIITVRVHCRLRNVMYTYVFSFLSHSTRCTRFCNFVLFTRGRTSFVPVRRVYVRVSFLENIKRADRLKIVFSVFFFL